MSAYVLEGSIGSGKSSVLEYINQHYIPKYHKRYVTIPEPVSRFTLLQSYYENPAHYLVPLQLQVAQELKKQYIWTDNVTMITERSLWAAYNVFLQMGLRDTLKASEYDKEEINALLKPIMMKGAPRIKRIIYLDAPPALCKHRMDQRGRQAESSVSLDYLQSLDKQYNSALEEYKHLVTRIDATRPIEEVAADVWNCITSPEPPQSRQKLKVAIPWYVNVDDDSDDDEDFTHNVIWQCRQRANYGMG